jgi:hypothetical protein
MFFNADRQTKDNIRNMYKQEAEIFSKKKHDEKNRKLQEEKVYLKTLEDKFEEDNRKKHMEKLKKINDTMGEYNQIMKQKDQNKNYSKHREINFNTYGLGCNNGVGQCQYTQSGQAIERNDYNQRNNEYENTLRHQKVEQQKLYRSYLDTQVLFN